MPIIYGRTRELLGRSAIRFKCVTVTYRCPTTAMAGPASGPEFLVGGSAAGVRVRRASTMAIASKARQYASTVCGEGLRAAGRPRAHKTIAARVDVGLRLGHTRRWPQRRRLSRRHRSCIISVIHETGGSWFLAGPSGVGLTPKRHSDKFGALAISANRADHDTSTSTTHDTRG